MLIPGPCQFPTLGFVVSRYNQVKSFVPETFWYIFLSLSRSTSSSSAPEETQFTWRRGHLFDFDVTLALYQHVLGDPLARVVKVVQKPTKKWYLARVTMTCIADADTADGQETATAHNCRTAEIRVETVETGS